VRYDPAAGRWQAGWAPRTFEPSLDEMRPDAVRNRLDEDGFAWEDIDCRWPAPAAAM
jgi:hypothetical protein